MPEKQHGGLVWLAPVLQRQLLADKEDRGDAVHACQLRQHQHQRASVASASHSEEELYIKASQLGRFTGACCTAVGPPGPAKLGKAAAYTAMATTAGDTQATILVLLLKTGQASICVVL